MTSTLTHPTVNPTSALVEALKDGPLLLDIRQVAARVGLSERTIWEAQKVGRLQSVRVGRSLRFYIADVITWIESGRVAVSA